MRGIIEEAKEGLRLRRYDDSILGMFLQKMIPIWIDTGNIRPINKINEKNALGLHR